MLGLGKEILQGLVISFEAHLESCECDKIDLVHDWWEFGSKVLTRGHQYPLSGVILCEEDES